MNPDLRYLADCARSGQMDSRQEAAHEDAGELPSCCEHHGFADKPDGCKCGRLCPSGRADLSYAWRYLRGYLPILIEFWDHAAAKRAGHLEAITRAAP